LAISKERKQDLVSQYKSLAESNTAMIITNCSGLNVKQIEALRSQIRESGGEFHIVKNTLAELAFKEADIGLPEGALDGPTAIGFASEDTVDVAKAIVDVSKDTDVLAVKGAVIDGSLFNTQQVFQLAELPPLPVVRAQLLGLIQTPAGNIARALASSVRQVVNVLNAYSDSEAAA
jgi:large subunit ribosomal protein L10